MLSHADIPHLPDLQSSDKLDKLSETHGMFIAIGKLGQKLLYNVAQLRLRILGAYLVQMLPS